jgi:hypothetical protein
MSKSPVVERGGGGGLRFNKLSGHQIIKRYQASCQLKFVITLGPESNPAVQGCLPQRLREGLTRWKEGNFQSGLHHLEEKKTPESLRLVEAIMLTFCGQKDSIRQISVY